MKCTNMKHILALLSWGQICILKDPEAFTFAKMEVGHPVVEVNYLHALGMLWSARGPRK